MFHLAAQTIVATANRSPLSTFETNVRGTYNLLEACRAVGVVGDRSNAWWWPPRTRPTDPTSELPYREDFAAAAALPLRRLEGLHGHDRPLVRVHVRAARGGHPAANVYGGGDLNWSRIVPDSCRALVRGKRPGDPL